MIIMECHECGITCNTHTPPYCWDCYHLLLEEEE